MNKNSSSHGPLHGIKVLDLSVMIVLLIIVFVRDWALPQLLYLLAGVPGGL
jgi:uncharacterized protein YggT (Ycf19 family)